jgi:hypothetical protein
MHLLVVLGHGGLDEAFALGRIGLLARRFDQLVELRVRDLTVVP